MDKEEETFELVVSFPDQSASFVNGYEAGMIWERMKTTNEEFECTTHSENREVLKRMSINLGWSMEHKECEIEGWDECKFTKTGFSKERPNPYGLRLVENSNQGN